MIVSHDGNLSSKDIIRMSVHSLNSNIFNRPKLLKSICCRCDVTENEHGGCD